MQLEKVYEPQRFEPHWAQWWIESRIFQVDARTAHQGRTFSLVIPPPNVTGALHIGHMLDHTIMDVAMRWHRMQGETTLWLPGTDHAGIATQMVVERKLAAEGLNRRQLGREEFERRVWQWKEEYGGRITHQIRREGASVDWSRERFTMDAGLSRAVREAFVRLYERGLIYRGEYMVNWCPGCQTAISDVETIHEAVEGHLWHIRYRISDSDETLTIATTRPETMLGDTALVVNPEDQRYLHLHGKTAILPILGREIPIIADPLADPTFGTGVVKVTPAHDPNDFEVGQRHGLPLVKVIGEDARMTNAAGPYAGLDRFEARKRILAALEQLGELVNVESYTVNIAKCDRSKDIIEPLVSTQWFVRMKPLAAKAMEAVRSGKIRFVPDDREIVFFHWMENIRDWCISRQLWWGHRIPAWHCRTCQEITVARETPAICQHCQSTEVEQDPDVLDTWFSSGLWPFSTLGWPDDAEDYRTFYPTSLLITGFDILFFWVSKMIMLGIECTGDMPFREVHMHGLVRDAERQKMSKTKGNVVDPLELIDRYGTDACRMALLLSASSGADIALKMDRFEAARGFANKIWNASRLIFMNMERAGITTWDPNVARPPDSIEDAWIEERLNTCVQIVEDALKVHRYHEAAQTLWDFVWKEFCDWYLEVKKLRFDVRALSVYERMLRLLHPFMPFLTEELWQRLMSTSSREHPKSISLAAYPKVRQQNPDRKGRDFPLVQSIVERARQIRADQKIEPKVEIESTLILRDALLAHPDLRIVETLAKLKIGQTLMDGTTEAAPPFTLSLTLDTQPNVASRARLEKDNARLQKAIESQSRQLSDEAFVNKAPPHVIESMRRKLAEYQAQFNKNLELLDGNAA